VSYYPTKTRPIGVPAFVDIRRLKGQGRFIAHKFSTGWAVDVVTSVEKKKGVAGQFAVKSVVGHKN
jgi:hypothetical protein